MSEGFQMKREYEERLHLETLICNRMNTSILVNLQTKKTITPEMLYKLSCDKVVKVEVSKEEMIDLFNKKEPIITNGKLRGYKDRNGKIELIN